ncbi:YfiT family bacillithiol transferase [Mariniflexile litorale]|uniref:YfiT family bacillithiol transferase n=1 Tax=Mariniflexile litorale TaxID=3045158 RepID=A0AAU7ECW7_9FLAO|nr:putative metal-dependent hydrolase [Mariniflexile sp. KMM 9835]MDQ8212183.1 putative metal-dependent hydrolase [Mariniflexile sp. KMM 9835]
MTEQKLQKLKYPIGHFDCPNNISAQHIESWISILEHFPTRLENLVKNLTNDQLDTVYRPDGWTIRQVIHHLSDSHHHSYTRFKWTLTEDKPVIKAYFEDRWAELIDSKTAPIEISLLHLKAVHAKLVYLLKGLSEENLNKYFIHPETQSEVVLKKNVGIYAWHSNHHYSHIENLMQQNNWI